MGNQLAAVAERKSEPITYTLTTDAKSLLLSWKCMGGSESYLCRGHTGVVEKWRGITVQSGRVTQVDWASERLRNAIPKEICCLDELTHLDLGGNMLSGGVPSGIGNLRKLKHLSLR